MLILGAEYLTANVEGFN